MARKRFLCRYRSSGRDFAAQIVATNAAEARQIMQNIDWAPGCGPIGHPERIDGLWQSVKSWIAAMTPSILGTAWERATPPPRKS